MLHAERVASVLLGFALACTASGVGQLPPAIVRPAPEQRVELWRADLAWLARELPARHAAPFRVVSEPDFRRSVERLDERIPALDDDGVVIELARLTASIGDGHTGFFLNGPRLGIPSGPLWLLALADGVFVKGVVGDLGVDVLNQRLVRVGGVPVEQALARLAPLIPRDNESGILTTGPTYLNMPRVLHAVGLSEQQDAARYVFADGAGNEVELSVRELAPGTQAVFGVRYAPGAPGAPLAERLQTRAYAFERVEGSAVLFYNASRDEGGEPFQRFCERVFADLDQDPPRQLVVDLRRNTGGNSAITRPLLRELRRRPHLTRPGQLQVLIGPRTSSSGMWAAVDLAREFDALLVGQPTGGRPNAPGERGLIVLPSSQLDCGVSLRLWNKGGKRYPGPALLPDLLVAETSTQHFAGRDPVLDAALTRATSAP